MGEPRPGTEETGAPESSSARPNRDSRDLRVWRWDRRPAGAFLVLALPLVYAGALTIRLLAPGLGLLTETDMWRLKLTPSERGLKRPHLLEQVGQMPGQHLVIVRYGPDYDPGRQVAWVYDRADIDHAPVKWARVGEVENARLLDHYRRQHAWLIEPGQGPVRLQRYRGSSRSSRTHDHLRGHTRPQRHHPGTSDARY